MIADLLGLPSLADIVEHSQCKCNPIDCPRRRAWTQLQSVEVRRRVAEICKLALLVEQEWLFRDIWDFLADMVLGGECADDPPSSAWFWRVFKGQSRLARALSEVIDPVTIALPRAEGRLYYSDWEDPSLRLVEDMEFMPLSRPDSRQDRFEWLKAQLIIMGLKVPSVIRLIDRPGDDLVGAVFLNRLPSLIKAINRYMTFGLREGSEGKLDLWVDHSVERRTERFHGLIRLGQIEANEFAIRRSLVVINQPVAESQVLGSNRFLVHSETGAAMALETDRLHLLRSVRPLRRSNRPHADLEWDLGAFFDRILSARADRQDFAVVLCDFDRFCTRQLQYRVMTDPPMIEVAE